MAVALVRLQVERVSDAAKRELASRFWEEDERCLDYDFSLKLRGLCESEHDIMGKASIKHALQLWAGRAKLANMHVERMLA